MLEALATKTRKGLAKQSLKIQKWMQIFPLGVWIMAAAIGLVGGRFLWVKANSPPDGKEITDDFGSVRVFIGPPQINHAGTKFTFMATGEKGYELFIYDLMSGKKQVVADLTDFGPTKVERNLINWPWSPDDGSFIYSEGDQLIICSGDATNTSTRKTIKAGGVSDLAWLNPTQFAYVVDETNLCYASKTPGGIWESHGLLENERRGGLANKLSCLTAISTNTVAWLEANYICRINLPDDMADTNGSPAPLFPVPDPHPVLPTNNLMLWLDASTLHQGDQTPVTGLTDMSLQKNHAAVYGTAPTYNAPGSTNALNGIGTIHFAFHGAYTNANGLRTKSLLGISGSTARTVFAITRPDPGREITINIGDTDSKGTYFGILDGDGVCYLPSGWWGADNLVRPQSGNPWNIFSVVYDGATQKGYVNGTLAGVTTFPYSTSDKEVEIGLRPPNHNGEFEDGSDGDFAELLIYHGALNEAEREQVEKYLSLKWFGTEPLYSKNLRTWLDPQLPGITGFRCSGKTGNFLITRNENQGSSLWQFNPAETNLFKIAESSSLRNVDWLDEGGFAYLKNASGRTQIILADSKGKQEENLLNCPRLDGFKPLPGGKQLLLTGIVSNELSTGIWQYDIASKQLQPIIPYSDFPSSHDRGTAPLFSSLETPAGRKLDYLVFFPAHFDRHKKYPVLLGDTTFYYLGLWPQGGREWMPAVAARGAFVVAINRPSWFQDIDQWGTNVMMVYQHLIKDHCIDSQQVYLYASSAETASMGDLMAGTPGLWKGGFLTNPSSLPDFSKSPGGQPRPKILISAGAEEYEDDWLKQYQVDAARYGVLVELAIEPGEGHVFVGNAAYLDRLRILMRFLFGA
jgi:hypothetical protein